MAVLQLFVTPGELDDLVRELSALRRLGACRYEGGKFVPAPPGPVSIFDAGKLLSRIFLFPLDAAWDPHTAEQPRPREIGWIDVSPGEITETKPRRIITMSTLQAEDRTGLPFKPASWVRGLKRSLAHDYKFGVVGTNVVHGGSHQYPAIGYSPKAAELHDRGVIWKQYTNDNSEFAPL